MSNPDPLETAAEFIQGAITRARDNGATGEVLFSHGPTVLSAADMLAVVERCRTAERRVLERDDENTLLTEELQQARDLYEHYCTPPDTAQLARERDDAAKQAAVLTEQLEDLRTEFLHLRAQLKDASDWGQRAWNAWRSARDRAQRARAAFRVLQTPAGSVTVHYWPAVPTPQEAAVAKQAVLETAHELLNEQQTAGLPSVTVDERVPPGVIALASDSHVIAYREDTGTAAETRRDEHGQWSQPQPVDDQAH